MNNLNKNAVTIGISACVLGEKVRYDGGSKSSLFCIKELANHVSFKRFCPEVAIGLPIPRKTLRQIKSENLIRVSRPDGTGDVTERLTLYGKKIAQISAELSGFIFCAKSPSCGLERVKVYSPSGNALKAQGVGLFAKEIMSANPLLPCEENGRLNDSMIRENFIARVFTYSQWQALVSSGLSKHKLTTFHSRYKYTVMSHDLVAYKKLGQLLARADLPLEHMANLYIKGLMAALTVKSTRKKHANTLAHIQGYFSQHLSRKQRQELTEKIEAFRLGLMPLMVPLTLINHYLLEFPKQYLAQQNYLCPYPEALKLRYGY